MSILGKEDQERREKLEKSFSQKSSVNDIEKAEGSRGGRVIGHTKFSNKPVYEKKKPSDYKDFTANEHDEAQKLHERNSKSYKYWEDKFKNNKEHGGEPGQYDDRIEKQKKMKEHHEKQAKLHEKKKNEVMGKELEKDGTKGKVDTRYQYDEDYD